MFRAAVVAALVAANAHAFTLTITNNCGSSIDVYLRQGGVYTDSVDTLAAGASTQKTIAKGFEGNFRNGSSTSATLVEFSTGGDYDLAWYDVSIIPPELTAGHEYCTSLDDCKANSATGIGYNTPVRLTPLSNTNGDNCRELNCLADYCSDAYLYPQDDLKTHACDLDTDFELVYCPDGSSGSVSSQTTESPTVTEAPATEAPTEAPVATTATPVQTTAAPVQTTAAPVATTTAPTTATTTDNTGAYNDSTANEANVTPAPTTPAVETAAPSTEAPAATAAGSKKTKYCV